MADFKLLGTTDEHSGRCDQCATPIKRAMVVGRLDVDGAVCEIRRVGSTCGRVMTGRRVTMAGAERAQHARIKRARHDNLSREYSRIVRGNGELYDAWCAAQDLADKFGLSQDELWEAIEPNPERRERNRRIVEDRAFSVDMDLV